MDKQTIIINLMKSTLQKILEGGHFDDLCEASAAVEATLEAVAAIESITEL